jgi:elongation factor P--(R)-beta-lysine ligase
MPFTPPPQAPSAPPAFWWNRNIYADKRPFLETRRDITRAVRHFFENQDFIEVETPILQISPGNETHLHGFKTHSIKPDGSIKTLYLHTSPEFSCKKLLAAGEERLFTLARVFRNRENSPLHAAEFTMLEWYRANHTYKSLMEDCTALIRLAAASAQTKQFVFKGKICDPFLEPQRLSVDEAFLHYAGIDLTRAESRDDLAHHAAQKGLRVTPDDTWSDLFSKIVSSVIEPHLGVGRATFLYDYPISEAALARPKPDHPRLAERFELYINGIEIANAFSELTNADEQRRRFELDMQEKMRVYGESYPLDEELLAALPFMPESAGCALGLDRLIMLASGATRLEQVMWVPVS